MHKKMKKIQTNIPKRHSKTQKKTLKKGGEVIGAGGFGCVFKPALKCSHPTRLQSQSQKTITKLLKKEDAKEEYDYIIKYKPILKTIPNYSAYFLIDGFSLCEPAPLTEEDLIHYTEECVSLKISKQDINHQLNKVLAIQMPYGGQDVGNYLPHINYDKYIPLNYSLMDLLVHGILPMNQKGIYHCDIKDANILVEDIGIDNRNAKLYTRLIDWGLSVQITTKNSKTIPELLKKRPFQFNIPFSNVLFNPIFERMYKKFLHDYPNPTMEQTNIFVKDYLDTFVNKMNGKGHLSVYNFMFKRLFDNRSTDHYSNLHFIKMIFLQNTEIPHEIIQYISKILVTFTINNQFNVMDYFSNVFLKNVDVWGYVMIYLAIMDELFENYNYLNQAELHMIQIFKEMIQILMTASAEPISIPQILAKCREFNVYFEKAYKTSKLKLNMISNMDSRLPELSEYSSIRKNVYSYHFSNVGTGTSLSNKTNMSNTTRKRKRTKTLKNSK